MNSKKTHISYLLVFVWVLFLFFLYLKFQLKLFESIDIITAQYFYNKRSSVWNMVFYTFSFFGKPLIVWALALLISIKFYKGKFHTYVLALLTSISLAATLSNVLKELFLEPRPILALYKEHWYSFPSFHATIAVAFYGFLIFWYSQVSRKAILKKYLFLLALILIIGIWVSRMYLDVHFLSDVLWWYILGFFILLCSIFLLHYLKK